MEFSVLVELRKKICVRHLRHFASKMEDENVVQVTLSGSRNMNIGHHQPTSVQSLPVSQISL
jgi:hypothetical protein